MREQIETLLIAMSICGVSIFLLLSGMSLGAMENNGKSETAQNEQFPMVQEDIIGNVISEFSVDSLQQEFANVNILTWDEYYELSGKSIKEEYKRGIYGNLDENSWGMEEAGLLALKEISYLENVDMDGMYLMMVMSNATSTQAIDIWRGYLCNFLDNNKPSSDKCLEYYIQINAYTGEVIRVEKKEGYGELRILLDNTNKVADVSGSRSIDYSAVPMCTLEEYFQLEKKAFEVSSDDYVYGAEGYLTMKDAGNIVLKEIHRLFGEDMVDMKLVMSFSDGKWGGWLLNDYDKESELHKSYSFRMDARSGKIWWLTGGKYNVNYTGKEKVSNEEIVKNVREIVRKYNLANVDKVDWSNVTVYNAGSRIKELLEEASKNPGTHITNYVEFYTDEGELMRIETDYETGELWMVLNKDYLYLYD